MSDISCYICEKNFKDTYNLTRHLHKKNPCLSLVDIHEKIGIMKNLLGKDQDIYPVIENTNTISSISLGHVSIDKMEEILEEFEDGPEKVCKLLGTYINNYILHDPDHKENHIVKYVRKNPLSFEISFKKDNNGMIVYEYDDLNGTINILSGHIYKLLYSKINKCIKKYKDELDTYNELKHSVNTYFTQENVNIAIKYVLKYNILSDKRMKVLH